MLKTLLGQRLAQRPVSQLVRGGLSRPALEEFERRLVPSVPTPDHVVVVIEENHAYHEIIGSSAAPYLNGLAAQGALLTNSFAIEHPSEPNYLDIFSGSNQGITSDGVDNPGSLSAPNLGQVLLAKGLTWGAYVEDLNLPDFDHDHAPWDLFNNAGCPGAVHDFSAWPTDFTQLPHVSIVTPNVQNDMHDGTIQQGDTWLQDHFDSYAQWAKTHNSLLIVTWDEDDGTQGNQVATLFVGQPVATGQYGEQINHFNLLRTVEDMYGLSYAGASATATPISDIWNHPPVLAPIPNQTIAASQQVLTVPLSASDPDGDPLTFTVTAQSLAYVLTQQTGTLTYVSAWDNFGGRGEKWLQATSGQWYFILANGELYQWDGVSRASGTLLGNVGASYHDDPTRLTNPPANQPHAALTIAGNTLLITRDPAWISGMQITVTVSDGLLTDSKTFTVTVPS
jgi:hypothetical protein